MKYFPDPRPQVPAVELMPLPTERGVLGQSVGEPGIGAEPVAEDAGQSQKRRTRSHAGAAGSIDIRQPIVNEFIESGNLEANSRKAYTRALKRFLGWSKVPFAEVTPRQLTQYREWLETNPTERTGKPLARASVNQEVAALKVFFGWLHNYYPHHCPTNPTTQLKQRQISVPPPADISAAALEWIWKALPTLGAMQMRDTLLVHLLAHGLRASEIVNLNLASFDGEALFLSETKNHSSRIVPLSQTTVQVIEQYLRWRQGEFGQGLEPELPLVVSLHVKHGGARLSYIGIYQAVERIGRRAKEQCILNWLDETEWQDNAQLPSLWWSAAQAIRLGAELGNWDDAQVQAVSHLMPHPLRQVLAELENLHPHSFRHTYATQLLLKGLDPAHARTLTGHQSQQMFRRYTQRAEQQAAVDAFRRLDEQQSWLP